MGMMRGESVLSTSRGVNGWIYNVCSGRLMGALSGGLRVVVGFVAGQGVLCLVDEVRHVGEVP